MSDITQWPVETQQIDEAEVAQVAPWFSTFNPFFCTPGSVNIYPLDDFYGSSFCALAPWEDHVVIAHHGADSRARAAGFEHTDDYIKHLIATAPRRGAFCSTCSNRKCATSA